jgi:hypothetical protein
MNYEHLEMQLNPNKITTMNQKKSNQKKLKQEDDPFQEYKKDLGIDYDDFCNRINETLNSVSLVLVINDKQIDFKDFYCLWLHFWNDENTDLDIDKRMKYLLYLTDFIQRNFYRTK